MLGLSFGEENISSFDTIPACDRWTDGRIDGRTRCCRKDRAMHSVARVKTEQKILLVSMAKTSKNVTVEIFAGFSSHFASVVLYRK